VRFDHNKHSVTAGAVGRPVEIHAYADRILIRQDGRPVGEHQRSFERGARHPIGKGARKSKNEASTQG
jgi:Mu transposase, C-terminal domain